MLRPGTPNSTDDSAGLSGSGSSGERDYASYDKYGKFFDDHTILIESGFATKAQILNALLNCLRTYNREQESELNILRSEIHVNTVLNKAYLPTGLTFIWISNSAYYHILLGRNPDGSDRVEKVFDDGYDQYELDLPEITDWSDLVEEEDEHSHIEPLPSLVEIPDINLTASQVRLGKQMTKDPNFSYFVKLSAKAAFVLEINDGETKHELFCSNCPIWVGQKQLSNIFRQYIPEDRRTDGYPKIIIKDPYNKGRGGKRSNGQRYKIATIKFDPSQRDAQFALHMTKKLLLSDQYGKNIALFFVMAKHKNKGSKTVKPK